MKQSLGVCYYPEHWPEDMWAGDAAEMVKTGLTWVRIGEFSWSRLEPEPERFTFDWLDRAIATLADAGLKIVLGTPSCTPPRWMLERFPDMLAVGADGHVRKFGSRRHYCFSHEAYRAAAAEMARILGERYGQDARIHAWQIDNEYGCHDTILSYSDAARSAFQGWCAKEYGSIAALNDAWGNVFWSMDYARFDQIDLPNQTVAEANPSHLWAFRRFSSDQVVAFHEAQVRVLRARTDRPLIHNYMGRVLDFDHFEVGKSIEIASWDSYPIGFLSDRLEATADEKRSYLQQGDPDMQAFHHDLYRAVGAAGGAVASHEGRWWVMEQQPGPVNWAPYNVAPLPGMVRLWSWEAFAHGAEVVSYFRWRQAPFAQEQMHAGLKRPDNVPAPGLAEAAQVAKELRERPTIAQAPAPVAIVFDYASHWAWSSLPQGADFDYFRLVFGLYKALRKLAVSIDFVPSTTTDVSAYKLVFAPGIAHMSDTLKDALAQTRAIVGPRSNAVSPEFTIPLPLGPDLRGLDATVARVESLPPDIERPVLGGGGIRHWQEELAGSAPVQLASKSGAAILVGDGLQYLGSWPSDALWTRIIVGAAKDVGIETATLPAGLRVRATKDLIFYFNYSSQVIVYKNLQIPPADLIWHPHP